MKSKDKTLTYTKGALDMRERALKIAREGGAGPGNQYRDPSEYDRGRDYAAESIAEEIEALPIEPPQTKVPSGETPTPPEFSMALWESLWRVVDAARLVTVVHGNLTLTEALEFLADQEKMLRRCLGGDEGESEMRVGVEKHPFVIEAEAAERERVRLAFQYLRGSSTPED